MSGYEKNDANDVCVKTPWRTPSLIIFSLENTEGGQNNSAENCGGWES